MITLNKIRELVLSQEQELEKLIFEYFLQKDITNYHNSSFNKNDKKNEIKLSIEDMISQGNLEKAKDLLYKYKEISGKDASYYSIAGIISLNENNIEDAFEKFTKGLNIDNTNSDLLYNIAYLNLVVGNTDEALEYYKRCINNTDDKDLIIEVTDIIDKLQDKISHTLITFGLTKEESMNFKGENRVIALIENDNLEHENNYEENGIINYEVNSKKSKDILGSTIQWGKGTGENLQYLCVPVGAVGGVFGGAGYYVGMGVADLFKKGNDVNFAQGKNFAIMLTQPLDIPLH